MRRFISAFLVVLTILIIASPKTQVRALFPTFHVPVLRNPVTLDGVIAGDEWADANGMNVTFVRDALTYDGTIYLKHDCTDLWMCIQVQDDEEDLGDRVGVTFDANGNKTFDVGDDAAFLVHDDQPMDQAYTEETRVYQQDDTIEGVMNVDGASEWEVGVYTFELSKPLNSGDSAGNDIALSPGDEINAEFIYVDSSEPPGPPPEVMFKLSLEPRPISVGVKAGDWAGYGDISFGWASNMSGYEEPPPEMNVSWADMEILDVSDSNITGRSTAIYANGTERTDVMWGDIATGEGNLSVGIIPSNLNPGDEIPGNLTYYTEEPLKLSINGTVTRSYAGANREVNYVNITYPIVYDNTTYGAWNMSFYWDKKTGVMCEENVAYTMSYPVNETHSVYMNMSILWRMTATNMWPAVFTAQDGYAFNVTMSSNSTISDFNFSEALKQISFNVTGPVGKAGYCNVTIPQELLQGSPWTVYVNVTDCTALCSITGNGTHTFIYVPYTCSTNKITIEGTWVVPEFPSAIILLLLMILTMLTVTLAKKRHLG